MLDAFNFVAGSKVKLYLGMQSKNLFLIFKLKYFLLFAWLLGGSSQILFSQVINYKTKVRIDEKRMKTTKTTVLLQVNNKQEN